MKSELNEPGTDKITVQFADGQEHTLPIHGIRQPQYLRILDQCEVKSLAQLNNPLEGHLQLLRCATMTAALALSFPGQESWTVEKIQENFADMKPEAGGDQKDPAEGYIH